MFGWGRKKDGFEWHKYVRTTIKLRREDRRARVLDAKEVAADGLKYAGRASVSAGSSGATMAWNGLISGIQALVGAAIAGGHAMARTVENKIAPAGRRLFAAAEPLLKLAVSGPVRALAGIVSLAAVHAAYVRYGIGGASLVTRSIALVGAAGLVFAVWPMFGGKANWSRPKSLGGLGTGLKRQIARAGNVRGLAVVAALVLLIAGGYFVSRKLPASVTSLAGLNPFAAKIVEGKATGVGGDGIRINGTAIRLSGIEAPEVDQKCVGTNKKKWSCGEAAQNALQKIIKGKTVRCEVSGSDAAGRSLGVCQTVNTGTSQDVAAALVKEGAVFSDGGLFSSYSSLESEAQAKKIGLWKGEADRPADYRSKAWETAVKTAPDGCPIKGQVAGDNKTYVLPWSPDYSSAKVRAARGERWFCSETEAQAAGWKIASR